MKTLKGRFTIGRTTSNYDNPTPVFIELEDKSSGCRLVEIRLSRQDFADALFGLAHVPCEFDLYDDCPVGKVREVKTVVVRVPSHAYKDRERVAAAALKAHEVDGWEGRESDALNMHNYVQRHDDGSADYRVTFIRFVDIGGRPA